MRAAFDRGVAYDRARGRGGRGGGGRGGGYGRRGRGRGGYGAPAAAFQGAGNRLGDGTGDVAAADDGNMLAGGGGGARADAGVAVADEAAPKVRPYAGFERERYMSREDEDFFRDAGSEEDEDDYVPVCVAACSSLCCAISFLLF